MIEKIECWKTLDGKFFNIEDQAIQHQYKLDIIERLKKFVENHISSGMNRWDIERILIDEVEELFGPKLKGKYKESQLSVLINAINNVLSNCQNLHEDSDIFVVEKKYIESMSKALNIYIDIIPVNKKEKPNVPVPQGPIGRSLKG